MLKAKEYEDVCIITERIYKIWPIDEEHIQDPRLKVLVEEYNISYAKMYEAVEKMEKIIKSEEVEPYPCDEDCEGCEECEGCSEEEKE